MVEQEVEEVAVARHRHGIHVSAAGNKHAIEGLLETVSFIQSMPRLYTEGPAVAQSVK
jgi:hypothetical protein